MLWVLCCTQEIWSGRFHAKLQSLVHVWKVINLVIGSWSRDIAYDTPTYLGPRPSRMRLAFVAMSTFVTVHISTLWLTRTLSCVGVCLPEVPIKPTHFSGEFSGKLGAEPHSGSTRIVSLDENLSHVSIRHRLSLHLHTKNRFLSSTLSNRSLLLNFFLFYSLN